MERGTGECPSARERSGCCSFDPGQGGVTFGGGVGVKVQTCMKTL